MCPFYILLLLLYTLLHLGSFRQWDVYFTPCEFLEIEI